jgi:hypothetical protein
MEGWFEIDQKTFPRDVLALMHQFDDVAAIIDDLLKQRIKPSKSPKGTGSSVTGRPHYKISPTLP